MVRASGGHALHMPDQRDVVVRAIVDLAGCGVQSRQTQAPLHSVSPRQ